MSLDEIIVLALVQGFSAVLPVSAWTHVLMIRDVFGWFDPAPQIVLAAHAGTLAAILLYLRTEVWLMAVGLMARGKRRRNRGQHLAVNVAIASIPILVGGLVFKWLWSTITPPLVVLAWLSVGYGVFFYAIDRFGMTIRRIEHMTIPSALAFGIAGIVALIPGAGRIGTMVLAARLLGYERADSARFGLLLSIPIMFASSPFGPNALGHDVSFLDLNILTAATFAFLASYIGIASLVHWISRERFTPFAIYQVVLGVGLLYWLGT